MTQHESIRILVVDDEAGMREFLSLELSAQGFQVLLARTGTEALEILRREKFHLVLSDMKMPEINGIALLEQIKSIDASIEVIMMTGHASVENAVQAMKAGAYDFVLKPFSLDELKVLIEKALEKKKLKGLVALYESSRHVLSTVKLADLCEKIMGTVVETFHADEGSLMLLNDQNKLYIASSRGISPAITKETQLEIGERISGLVARNRKEMLFINGVDKYPEFSGMMTSRRIQSSIVCPLLSADGTLLGVLNLNRTRSGENFDVIDLHGVSVFASIAAVSIANARLFEKLEDNVSELHKAQDQLLQSEKLASIGRLVAGVAHELNNPLTSVIGYSQLASASSTIDEMKKSLPVIYEQALRCSKIVKDLLIFARQRKVSRQCTDAYHLIEESLNGVSLEMEKRKIRVEWKKPPEPLALSVDPVQMKQVFTNLLTNSFQAMETITGEKKLAISVELTHDRVRFSFSDNGPGIPDAIAGRIFDPFFTTKDVGQGTGLGLSLSYGVIKEHGGMLTVQKGRTSGACFIVELPIGNYQEMAVDHKAAPAVEAAAIPAAVQKILLVEDEPPIRQLIANILHNGYYQFDVAEDGKTALEKIMTSSYDLILCDYRIPLLNGISLYNEVKKIKPETARRFLFVSGSTEFAQNSEAFFESERLICLLKPFTRNELIEAVGKMIKPAQP